MRRAGVSLALAILLLLAGCVAGPQGASPPAAPSSAGPSETPPPTPPRTPTPTPTPTPDPIAGLPLEQRVGQLFVVGTPAGSVDPQTLAAVAERHIGGVFLHGRSNGGVAAAAAVVAHFTGPDAGAQSGIPLWVVTDQEGGEVQVLRGPGFDDIPYAIRQADLPPPQLRDAARRWGQQLREAGVTLNLAPVADIVTSHDARFANPPIGGLGRQYGYDESTVAAYAGAFADGMRDAGVTPTLKHFPGLGRVTANTDHAGDVADTTVTADGPDVGVYRALLSEEPALVMVGFAVYENIDGSAPAVFSAPIVTGILRGDLGYDGVVITDDLSAATAVAGVAPADRAIRALTAGVDVLLLSSGPATLPAMYDAVLERARSDPAFAERVDESARRVAVAKLSGP
ncbi:glycoside hydrolase family 3 protein [Microbacterium saccharophilum]|uniref:beta-N-acetylhexosaminidase n=1 Tax=Microbacterium saccharophilum TaxID=1213358 RepID=A0A5C8I9X8_9MICO|nr:glycoside hydrolase family 3 N-terminal domain-containing protein [Microbacterium saccharophilum]TXK15213.1 glycoside hydrolase family 3 protein [Microbacterium saccharophilum]GEP49200.1 beta-glucosidase [Microbacterium saccharophilum]